MLPGPLHGQLRSGVNGCKVYPDGPVQVKIIFLAKHGDGSGTPTEKAPEDVRAMPVRIASSTTHDPMCPHRPVNQPVQRLEKRNRSHPVHACAGYVTHPLISAPMSKASLP